MDDFSDILAPGAVTNGLLVQTKKALFGHLAARAADLTGLDADRIADSLSERERLGSTGFGGGIGIPHGKIAGLDRVVGLFVRLGTPIEFRAIDDQPVDLVFALLSPADGGVDHLKALARVSRRLRDKAFVAKLRGAGSEDALFALFVSGDQRHAA